MTRMVRAESGSSGTEEQIEEGDEGSELNESLLEVGVEGANSGVRGELHPWT